MLPAILDWAEVLLVLICFNVAVSAIYQILEKIKDKTATDVDNKVYEFIGKYAGWLQKVIDYISANLPKKPEEPKQ